VNDARAYEAVGVPSSRVFLVNRQGEVTAAHQRRVQTRYGLLASDLLDYVFPSFPSVPLSLSYETYSSCEPCDAPPGLQNLQNHNAQNTEDMLLNDEPEDGDDRVDPLQSPTGAERQVGSDIYLPTQNTQNTQTVEALDGAEDNLYTCYTGNHFFIDFYK